MSHAPSEEKRLPLPVDWRAVADNIVTKCLRVAPGEVVQLGGGVHNFDLIGALAASVRRLGAYPELNVTSDDLQLEMLMTVPEEHLRTAPPHRLRWLEDVDAMIVTDSVCDPSRADGVPRERRIAAHAAAEAVERRLFELGLRWAYVGYPTPGNTSGLPTPFDELQPLFWQAVDVDYDRMSAEGAALASILEEGREIRIVTDRGTDLTLSIENRPVLIDDGVISSADVEEGNAAAHLPAGRVLVAPVETSASGRVVIDWAWEDGQAFSGLAFQFENGRLTAADGPGIDGFLRRFELGRGDKDRLGALAIGLNAAIHRFTGYRALDEKRRGSVHLSLGDNRLFGGRNVSSFHFDLFLESASVFVDGRPVAAGGDIVLSG